MIKLIQVLARASSFVIFAFLICSCQSKEDQNSTDVVVYGGTSAGISAAIQAARLGKSVILIEPTNRLGGLTTGGLGQTDIGNKQVIGGISREFYTNIKKHYANDENWILQYLSEYKDGGQTQSKEGEYAKLTNDPSDAMKVYHDMRNKDKIKIDYKTSLAK